MQETRNKSWFIAPRYALGMAISLIAFGLAIPASGQMRKNTGSNFNIPGTTLTEQQVDSALARALPGRTSESTGVGKLAEASGGSEMQMGPGRYVNMADLPVKAANHVMEEGADFGRPLSGLTEQEYEAFKRLMAQRLSHAASGPQTQQPQVARPARYISANGSAPIGDSVGASTAFAAQGENGLDPPDMALAVSENFVLQIVNSSIAVYSKSGTVQSGFPKDAATFFNRPGTFVFDPRAFYDWANHRFFLLMDTYSNCCTSGGGTNVSGLVFAISETQDPRGGWYTYYLDNGPLGSGVCGDFPTLGHDTTYWGTGATKGGVYIGVNLWTAASGGDCSGSSFSSNVIFILPKDALYTGGGYSYWQFNGLKVSSTIVDTFQPINVTDRAEKPSSILFVNSFNYNWGGGICESGCNGLEVWSISGPTTGSVVAPNNPFAFLQGGNGPILTGKGVATAHTYYAPAYASAPNCTASSGPCIDTDYPFISGQVKYHAGEMFGSLNTGVSGSSPAVTGPIWFDIHPTTNASSVLTGVEERQEDCFVCGGFPNNGSAYYADLQPDQENNVVMVYNYSDDTTYPESAYTSRRVIYGDSLMNGSGFVLTSGSGATSGRWGDYTATAPDFTIATRGLLWFSAEYATSSGAWSTTIGAAQYSTSADQ
jgi:hypothetical protein